MMTHTYTGIRNRVSSKGSVVRILKKMVALFAAVAFLSATAPLKADTYCDESGCGYEDTCCAPNYCMIGLGVLTAAALIVAVIVIVQDDDDLVIHAHP